MNSKSPISGIEYDPVLVSKQSEELLEKITAKSKNKLTVGVQGLGFVGAASASVIANNKKEFNVIGFEAENENGLWKIGDFNNKILPILSTDKKLKDYFQNACNKNLCATSNVKHFDLCDIILVDINLDVDKKDDGFEVSLSAFEFAIRTIFQNCNPDCLIIIETTVPPGTCEKIVLPIAEQEFKRRGFRDHTPKIGHSYERVTPGPNYVNSIENFYRVYSGVNEISKKETKDFLSKIINVEQFPLTELDNTNASELAKVLENSYRALNIAFIDEWTKLAEKSSVNLYDVINAIKMRPTHSNIMKPGLGVGGYCLTKDPLLASWASVNFFNHKPLPFSENAVLVNDDMPLHTAGIIKASLKERSILRANVLILGVSYLNDISDTRSSPTEILYDELIKTDHKIFVHDPIVKFWPEKDMHINNATLNEEYDYIILAVGHSEYKNQQFWDRLLLKENCYLLDTMGYLSEMDIELSKFSKIQTLGVGK